MRLDLPGKLNHFEDAGIGAQFATSALANKARLRKTSSISRAVTRNPMASMTRTTKKLSNNMPSSGSSAAEQSNDRKKEKPIDRVQEDFPTMFGQRPDSPPFANQPTRPIWGDIR